jgi:hypothetical protein
LVAQALPAVALRTFCRARLSCVGNRNNFCDFGTANCGIAIIFAIAESRIAMPEPMFSIS